jgi:hypothetical protein
MEPLHETMYEALQRHLDGIDFRERGAGPAIDSVMRSEGFSVQAWIDSATGLVFGGNRWNCGTWMDKVFPFTFFFAIETHFLDSELNFTKKTYFLMVLKVFQRSFIKRSLNLKFYFYKNSL